MKAVTVSVLLCLAGSAATAEEALRIAASCTPEQINALALPCTEDQPCPLYLELTAAEQVGPRTVLTGSVHTGSATLESMLLISDDGGLTWTEPHPRIPAAVLDQIQFIDFEAGWVNGHSLTNIPRDAFFLLTTDGGKTWRKRPIFGEPRTGAVEQFWFHSRTNGRLALDRVRAAENGMRYELWESLTGGESWNVRQVDSRPVPFRRPQRDPLMRIRPDAAGKVHIVERREGDNWSRMATFQISAGECKPVAEQPALAEPPPPPPDPEPPAAPKPKRRRPPTLREP